MFTSCVYFTKDVCGYFMLFLYGILSDHEWGDLLITLQSILVVRNGILSDHEWGDVLKTVPSIFMAINQISYN